MSYDVLVVGAGVIGLSTAYHAARDGARVAVVDRAAPGSGASGAAAGMLAAQIEPEGDTPLYRFGTWSRSLYPALAGSLSTETGIDIELVTNGIMELAHDPVTATRLQGMAAWQLASGQDAQWLAANDALEWVPAAPQVTGALLAPADGHVHPERLVRALTAACQRRGVVFHLGEEVVGLRGSAGRATGLRTAHNAWSAGAVVLAAGAHTGALAALMGVTAPVSPMKGQILALEPTPPLRARWARLGTAVYYAKGCYLVPRRNGEIVVGASAEFAGFDSRVTAGELGRLLLSAVAEQPDLAGATFRRAWSGLRPITPDLTPVMGPLPGWNSLFVASGHFRNGILLTPGTGALMAALLAGQVPELDLGPFSPDRFATSASSLG